MEMIKKYIILVIDATLTGLQCSTLSLVEECRGLALIGRELQSVATPALLCHKEPARRIQSPLLEALERSSLVLYGIKAPIIRPFRACREATYPLWHKRAGGATL